MAIKENREYRSFNAYEIRKKEDDAESYIVEGYAAIFDEPYTLFTDDDGTEYKECISSKAFAEADMSDIIFLYNHEGRVYARQKNNSLEVTCDEKGIRVKADLGLTKGSRELFEDIDAGLIDQMSWAFTINADEYDKNTRTRTVTSVRKVYDVSAVSIPANPATTISARNWLNGVIEAEQAERLERAKEEVAIAKAKFIAKWGK